MVWVFFCFALAWFLVFYKGTKIHPKIMWNLKGQQQPDTEKEQLNISPLPDFKTSAKL